MNEPDEKVSARRQRHRRDDNEAPEPAKRAVLPAATIAEGRVAATPAPMRLSTEERLSRERERLLAALAAGKTNGLHERVAWILSRLPTARNSDIALQFAYWRAFEPEAYALFERDPGQSYSKLTRLTSLARARAKIQNQHRLFLASPEVRKRRGQLSEEERERHGNDVPPSPVITVFADESGKTGKRLIVGSVWFLEAANTFSLVRSVLEWRQRIGFESEFHYSDITRATLPIYQDFVELVMTEVPLIGFKSISVLREGFQHLDSAFENLFYELLRRGIEHEHTTGRAPLPRQLIFWKDEEAEGRGRDQVILARLRDKLTAASGVYFRGQLTIDLCESLNSKSQPLLQLADLYAGSINRIQNRDRETAQPRDVFADYFLARVRNPTSFDSDDNMSFGEDGDAEIHLNL